MFYQSILLDDCLIRILYISAVQRLRLELQLRFVCSYVNTFTVMVCMGFCLFFISMAFINLYLQVHFHWMFQYATHALLIHTVTFQAARDACKQMGDRKFCDQMMSDACQHIQQKITSDVDVASLKEYVQVRPYMCHATLHGDFSVYKK